MNNIQKFLEEKSKATASYLNCNQEDVYVQYLMVVDFVLSEVAREWFKAKAETFSGQDEAEKCVETIINNLRIKL